MGIVDLVFPKQCLWCGTSGSYVCGECVRKVKRAKQTCIKCGKPSIDGMTHHKCRTPLGLDGVFSIWEYKSVVRKSLLKLKYKFAFEIADELSHHIFTCLSQGLVVLPKKSTLIPVPLHRKRKNWRGFNQVEKVGEVIAARMKWNFNAEVLLRKTSRRPQTELKGDERKSNILGVFALNPKYRKLKVENQTLILFDDVLTTGATIKEAGKVLKRNGAKVVWGLMIAK